MELLDHRGQPLARRGENMEAKGINESLARLVAGINGAREVAGVVVTEDTALTVSTVAACVTLIASDVATLPLKVRKMGETGMQDAGASPEYNMLLRKPNPQHTAFEFRQMLTAQAVLRNDAYAFKMRDGRGRVRELWPLRTRDVQVRREGMQLRYTVHGYEGAISGEFGPDRIMHLRNMMWDGMNGLDRLAVSRDNIGLAAAAANTQASAFKNGTRMPGYWTTDAGLTDGDVTRLAEQLISATTGSNQYKSPVLDNGLSYKTTGQSLKDAELVDSRKHQIIEICAAFGVVPSVLGIDDKTNAFASVEAMMRWHLQHTLRPWLTCWEQALDRDVLDGAEGPLYAKFDTSDMEKASTQERAQSYRDLVELGIMTRNEARALEGLPRLDGLDEPLTPLNMAEGQNNGQED